jgi:hypothetical protein
VTDSSDEEWEEEFWRPAPGNRVDMDAQVDTREMIHDAFECRDDPTDLEYRVREEVLQAFTTADDLHKECSQGQSSSGDDDGVPADIGEHAGNTNPMADTIDKFFDAEALEEALFEVPWSPLDKVSCNNFDHESVHCPRGKQYFCGRTLCNSTCTPSSSRE